jgi:MFS transporter, DHA1 family, multidrug resistance protein
MRRIFPPLAFAMFSSNLGMGIVAPLLSIYARDMGASGIWIGLVMASYAIANIVSTPLFGRISDRKGRKIILWIGLLAYSLISLGYIFSTNLLTLCLVRFLHGAAGGMVLPIATAYIGDVSPKGEEGKWMGYASAAFYAGFGIGPLLGGVLSQYVGMTFTFSFMAGLNLAAFFIILAFLPEVETRRSKETGPRSSFKEIFRSKIVSGLFIYQISGSTSQGCFTTFLPIIATARGLSITLVGIIISCTISFMSLLGAAGGSIADRLNKRLLIAGGSVFIVFSLLMIPQAGVFWTFLVLAFVLAFGAGISNPAISALGVTEGRKYGMGSTMGVINMGMNIGFALGPVIAGEVADLGQYSYAFYFSGGILAIGILVFVWLTRSSREAAITTPRT